MKAKANLLRIHNLADAYGRRPSEIMGLQTPWGAYQFDEVCLAIGRFVENNLNKGKPAFDGFGGERETTFSKLRGVYQSVKARVKKRVRIKENGTW